MQEGAHAGQILQGLKLIHELETYIFSDALIWKWSIAIQEVVYPFSVVSNESKKSELGPSIFCLKWNAAPRIDEGFGYSISSLQIILWLFFLDAMTIWNQARRSVA